MNRRHLIRRSTALGFGLAAGLPAWQRAADACSMHDYRALVAVCLTGGADAFNTLVPWDLPSWTRYRDARTALALPRESLVPLRAADREGRRFALHSAAQPLAKLFAAGKLAFVANVGTLIEPTRGNDYRAGRARLPPGLKEHPAQSEQWETAVPRLPAEGHPVPTGVLGRMEDLFPARAGNPPAAALIGVDRPALTGRRTTPHPLDIATVPGDVRNVIEAVPTLEAAFPAYYLAQQLRLVARLIAAGRAAGLRRQIFYLSIGTWDFHKGGTAPHARVLEFLAQSLSGFQHGLAELGMENEVTTFTISDFARELAFNGSGADHGWGSHHMVLGGAVRGGRIVGSYPEPVLGGDRDIGRGVFIPSISVDEYYADLALWFGVQPGDLTYVLPHLGRFVDTGSGAAPPLGLMRS